MQQKPVSVCFCRYYYLYIYMYIKSRVLDTHPFQKKKVVEPSYSHSVFLNNNNRVAPKQKIHKLPTECIYTHNEQKKSTSITVHLIFHSAFFLKCCRFVLHLRVTDSPPFSLSLTRKRNEQQQNGEKKIK